MWLGARVQFRSLDDDLVIFRERERERERGKKDE